MSTKTKLNLYFFLWVVVSVPLAIVGGDIFIVMGVTATVFIYQLAWRLLGRPSE